MSQMIHLHFLKPGSEHLHFGVLDLLGSLIGSLEDCPHLFSGLRMKDPVKFISRNTTKDFINSLTIGICQSKGNLVPLGVLNGIPNDLINSTKKSTCTYFPKRIITPIKERRCVEGLRSIHLKRGLGSQIDNKIQKVYLL